MAALHSSALQSLEGLHKLSCKPQPDLVRKPGCLPSLRQAANGRSLTWTSRSASFGMLVSATGGATLSSVDSEAGISYQKLQELLAAGEWELADEETRRLIIVLAGENAVKRKYVYFTEVQFMPKADLATIDRLWLEHSDGKFGYSVQRKILKRVDGDCTAFFKKVGWMKPLGSDSAQYTYRSFPSEFTWELGPSTPVGHLPLTNALRGTQLLQCLLEHPAFEFADDDLQVPSASAASSSSSSSSSDSLSGRSQQQQKKPLSIGYSF